MQVRDHGSLDQSGGSRARIHTDTHILSLSLPLNHFGSILKSGLTALPPLEGIPEVIAQPILLTIKPAQSGQVALLGHTHTHNGGLRPGIWSHCPAPILFPSISPHLSPLSLSLNLSRASLSVPLTPILSPCSQLLSLYLCGCLGVYFPSCQAQFGTLISDELAT